jgi:RimJ/RimL family protein N-acetyltransferase
VDDDEIRFLSLGFECHADLFPDNIVPHSIPKRTTMTVVQTERLILRHWRESDREPFARMNADPFVMQYMPALLTPEQSDAMMERIEAHFQRYRFGLCAVELRNDQSFAGFIGLAVPSFRAHFTPCVEIGWRLPVTCWGRGLATEGAQSMVQYAAQVLGLRTLVSFTVPANIRSRRVMEKLGMSHDAVDDFDHPGMPEAHPFRRQVLYRLRVHQE